MASGKYIGYVGGMAVAVGVGAAIAAAGQGTANADTDSGSTASTKGADSSSGTADAGPKKTDAKKADAKKAERPKPLKDLEDRAEKVTASLTKAVTGKKREAGKRPETADSDEPVATRTATTRKPKPTAEEFEAGQVRKLKDLFQPKETAAPTPATDNDADTRADADAPVTTAAEPWSPNPFRPEDPTPTDMPADVVALRDALVGAAIAPEFQPFIREGVEAGYRVSQMVPWVNAVVPLTKIVPALPEAIGGDPAAKDATQIIVNELLKTTQPVSLLYYGYDEIADLANLEAEGDELKQQFYVNAWNILDPFAILHNPGTSGIGNGAGAGLTL